MCDVENKSKLFIDKLKKFERSWQDLAALWLELDSKTEDAVNKAADYPFDRCFYELSREVMLWRESVESELKDIENGDN